MCNPSILLSIHWSFYNWSLSIKTSCQPLINEFFLSPIHLGIDPSVNVSIDPAIYEIINHVTHQFIHPFTKVSLCAYSPHRCGGSNSVNPITLHSECDVGGTTSLVSGHTPVHGETLPSLVIVFPLFPQIERFMVQSNSTLPPTTSTTTTTTNNNSI